MAITLEQIAKDFLADTKYQTRWKIRLGTRDSRMPGLRTVIRKFTEGHTNLETFRSHLNYNLPQEAWDSSSQKNSREWLLAELTTLAKYHKTTGEEALRSALIGLNADNIGQRIEQFHSFLQREADRFDRDNLKGRPMAPLNSALMISLIASMLDPKVYFCDVYLRRGLSVLRDMGAITISDDISYHDGNIEIRSFEDYLYVKEALDEIVARVPSFRTTPAWAEMFTRWVIDRYPG